MKPWLLAFVVPALSGCERQAPVDETPRNEASITGAPIVETTMAAKADPPVSRPSQSQSATPHSPARPTPSANDAAYRAIGTEPFWAVTIKGSQATLERPDKAPVRYTVNRADDGRALRYLGDGFTLTVTPGPCSDGMSDAIWRDRVAVAFGEGTWKGCGGEREQF